MEHFVQAGLTHILGSREGFSKSASLLWERPTDPWRIYCEYIRQVSIHWETVISAEESIQ